MACHSITTVLNIMKSIHVHVMQANLILEHNAQEERRQHKITCVITFVRLL